MSPGGVRERPRLEHIVAQRLLAIDVLSVLNGQHRRRRMVMVGRGDKHRVDLLVHGVEHPPVIGERLRLSAPLGSLLRGGLRGRDGRALFRNGGGFGGIGSFCVLHGGVYPFGG